MDCTIYKQSKKGSHAWICIRKHYERTATIEEKCAAQAIKDLMDNLVDFGDFHADMIFQLCIS